MNWKIIFWINVFLQVQLVRGIFDNIRYSKQDVVHIRVYPIPYIDPIPCKQDSNHLSMPEQFQIKIPVDGTMVSIQVWREQSEHYKSLIPTYEIKGKDQLKILQTQQQNQFHIYHNLHKSVSFHISVICTENRKPEYTLMGSFFHNGSRYLIEPLPNANHHIMSKSTSSQRQHQHNELLSEDLVENDHTQVTPRHRPGRLILTDTDVSTSTTIHTFKVEMLIIVDYFLYSSFYNVTDPNMTPGKRSTVAQHDIQKYIGVVMDSVNVAYKSLSRYSIFLEIVPVAVLISTDPVHSPWSEGPWDFTQFADSDGILNGTAILSDIQAFVGRLTSLPVPDHTVLMTGYLLDTYGTNSTDAEGFAGVGTMCFSESTSVVREYFDFTVMYTIAHEIGHSLGSEHDGDGNGCSADDGYIMTPKIHRNEANEWIFSACTASYFKDTILKLKRYGADCMTTTNFQHVSNYVDTYSHKWYGQMYSADEQCIFAEGPGSYLDREEYDGASNYSSVCLNMKCSDPHSSGKSYYRLEAGDGTVCGHDKWCMAGMCVDSSIKINVSDSCPFEDQPGLILYGRSCMDLIQSRPQDCQIPRIRKSCCLSCSNALPFNPGTVNISLIPSVHEQCRGVHGTDSKFCQGVEDYKANFESICKDMYCLTDSTNNSCTSIIAADGTPCGYKKWCQAGVCVSSQYASDLPGACMYGDRIEWCSTHITGPDKAGLCYLGNNAELCCNTCSTYKISSNPDSCPFGDHPGLILHGRSCMDLIQSRPQDCQIPRIKKSCCLSCSNALPFNPECSKPDLLKLLVEDIRDFITKESQKDLNANSNTLDSTGSIEFTHEKEIRGTVNISLIPSVHEQCRGVYGTDSKFCQGVEDYKANFESMCKDMYCLTDSTNNSCTSIIAADGTPCGYKKWCQAGVCVSSRYASDLPGDCLYGDKSDWCSTHITGPDKARLCYLGNNAELCCNTCSTYKISSNPGSCLYGDRIEWCSTHITGPDKARLCYLGDNAELCCNTCSSYKNSSNPDCLYGDKSDSCSTTIPSSKKAYNCYDSTNIGLCCATCDLYKDPNDKGCEYGDRANNCDRADCATYTEASRTSLCCRTCQ